MWTRVFLLALFLFGASALAQTVPNFAGVFLETGTRGHYRTRAWSQQPEDPLVLDIEQNAHILRLMELQNGSQAIYLYNLDGRTAKNETPQSGQTTDRLHFKDGSLIIRSEVTGDGQDHEIRKETWSLSPDLHTLTMQPGFEPEGNPAYSLFLPTEIYTRQTNLDAALAKAAKTSRMNNCVPSQRYPVKHPRDISHGVPLGGIAFEQLGWTETFDADLRGEFFTNLKILPAPGDVEFRREKELVTKFSGSLSLIVRPAIRKEPHWVGSTSSTVMGGWRFTDALKGLRFHILWAGSDSRDLGDVPAELKSQVWVKSFPPENWYEMEIPAQDVPITDSLEIHILSAAGTQLGCISGHL